MPVDCERSSDDETPGGARSLDAESWNFRRCTLVLVPTLDEFRHRITPVSAYGAASAAGSGRCSDRCIPISRGRRLDCERFECA